MRRYRRYVVNSFMNYLPYQLMDAFASFRRVFGYKCFRLQDLLLNFQAHLNSMVEEVSQLREEGVTCVAVDEVQEGLTASQTEGKAFVSIALANGDGENQCRWEIAYFIDFADER